MQGGPKDCDGEWGKNKPPPQKKMHARTIVIEKTRLNIYDEDINILLINYIAINYNTLIIT